MVQRNSSVHQTIGCHQSSLATDYTRGEVYCEGCGLVVVQNIVDNLSESQTISKEDYLNRTRAEGKSKLYFHDRGLATKIPFSSKDASGKFLSSKVKQKFKRLRVWDSRAKANSSERRMKTSFTILDTITSKLGLSDSIKEKAAYFYRKSAEKKIIQGRTIKAMTSASLYAACREANAPRSLDDIARAANVRRKDLSSAYRHLIKNLGIGFRPHDPKNYVNRIASHVGVNEKSKRLAWKILDAAKKSRLALGKKPMGIAGASVYIAAAVNNQRISYAEIERTTHVSSITLRKLVKMFVKKLSGIQELDGAVL
ncbi:MAG: transcription initiation factor IIB family protein [Nitrosopumilaceae archaeon]